MHKTGSTSIQTALEDGVPGLGFASMGRNNNHGRSFARAFSKAAAPEKRKTGEELRAKLAQEIKDCKEDKFLITGERISIFGADTLTRFLEFVTPLCDDLRVIGYVRPPHGLMQSHFQQHLKGGLAGTYYGFDPAQWYKSYHKRFDKFDQVFGREKVTLKIFDRDLLADGDIVADFFKEIDVPAPKAHKVEANTSLSLEAISLLYVMRKFGPRVKFAAPGVSRREGRIVAKIATIGEKKFSISPALTTPIIEQNQDDMKWIEERLGAPLSEKVVEKPDAVTSEDDFIRIAMEIADEAVSSLGLKVKGDVKSPKQLGRILARLRDKDDKEQAKKKGLGAKVLSKAKQKQSKLKKLTEEAMASGGRKLKKAARAKS